MIRCSRKKQRREELVLFMVVRFPWNCSPFSSSRSRNAGAIIVVFSKHDPLESHKVGFRLTHGRLYQNKAVSSVEFHVLNTLLARPIPRRRNFSKPTVSRFVLFLFWDSNLRRGSRLNIDDKYSGSRILV